MSEEVMEISAKGVIYLILRDINKTNEVWDALVEHGKQATATDPDADLAVIVLEGGGVFVGGSRRAHVLAEQQ